MIELDKDTWDKFVSNFTDRLMRDGYSADYALKCFVNEYWMVLDSLASKAEEEGKEEDYYVTKPYLHENTGKLWDYVYNLQKQVNSLQSKIGDLETHKTQTYGPVKWPNNVPSQIGIQPYSFPDTHIPPWTVSSSNMYDNAPPNNQVAIGTSGGFMSTTGGTTVTLNGVSAGTVKVKGLYD